MTARKRPTLFLHIPRTGGLLIADHLRRKLGVKSLLTVRSSRELAYLRDDELASHDFILAQTNAFILRRLPKAIKLTVMRDPLDRVLATYAFYRRQSKETPTTLLARKMSLAEFVASDHPAILRHIDNGQARRLALHVTGDEGGERRGALNVSGQDLLERARAALDLFDAVGRFEALDIFAERLRRLYGWRDAGGVELGMRELKPADSSKIAPKVLQSIRERTGIDQALYEEVRAREAAGSRK